MPTAFRRLAWWATFNLSGHKRATRLGTFALTTLAAQGTTIDRPPSIHTSTLTYGPLDDAGRSQVSITYDHRLMDGLAIAGCLARLEQILNGPIIRELEHLAAAMRSRPAGLQDAVRDCGRRVTRVEAPQWHAPALAAAVNSID
jgi:hypothetical protein